MKRILFSTALLLFIFWALGFFVFKAGMFIHGAMMLSAILCMQAIIISPRPIAAK